MRIDSIYYSAIFLYQLVVEVAVGTLNIVFPILPIYWAPSLLSDNAKRALNYFDNKPSNLEFCPNKHSRKQHLKRGKSRTCGINFNPLTARRGRAYDYKSQIPCNAYSGQRLVTAFMSHRPPRRDVPLRFKISLTVRVQSCHFIQIFSRVQLEKAPFSEPRRKV